MPRGIGYGKKARGRGRAIRGGGRPERLPGGNLPRRGPMPEPQGGGRGKGRQVGKAAKAAVGQQGMPGPGGAQLQRRVKSGAISKEQAEKTMKQRQTLQKAFGKDWRTKVFGDRGYMQRTRVARSKNPKSPKLAALEKRLKERRSKMLDVARAKNKGRAKTDTTLEEDDE